MSKSHPNSAIRPGLNERVQLLESTAALLRSGGLIHQLAEDRKLDGRRITLGGKSLVHFGSCSYLGLETDDRLKHGACEAVLRYGTQFSSSRAYVSAPLYEEYEALLSRMVGGYPVVVAASTSLAHLAALPVLVGENDAVLYDVQVHASVQAVLPALRLRGVRCEPVRHNRLDRVEQRARLLGATHRRVFYLCDGVYSMHGDAVDVDGLFDLLDRLPQLIAYVDDAHGVGWAGRSGAGIVLGRRPMHQRMTVTLGLSKAFAAAGGLIVLPRAKLAERVFTCGSTLIFSGPLQPAQLGAGIASAQIHLSDEITVLQDRVLERIARFEEAAEAEGLSLPACEPSPIRFVQIGDEELAVEVGTALRAAGYFVNVAVYPAVARGRAGIRLMLNARQTLEDIAGLVQALAREMRSVGDSRRVSVVVPKNDPPIELPRAG